MPPRPPCSSPRRSRPTVTFTSRWSRSRRTARPNTPIIIDRAGGGRTRMTTTSRSSRSSSGGGTRPAGGGPERGGGAPDGSRSELADFPFEEAELCPPGAFDDLEPDEQYFHEATGNEGAS